MPSSNFMDRVDKFENHRPIILPIKYTIFIFVFLNRKKIDLFKCNLSKIEMSTLAKLKERAQNVCELCSGVTGLNAYTVPPREDDTIDNQVAVCETCQTDIKANEFKNSNHWRCLTGSIWSDIPAVQALSYKILNQMKSEDWASDTLDSVFLDDSVIDWALAEERAAADKVIHKDGYGNILESGDNVVLIENLNVKGTNYIAPKGTMVRKIRLIHDNAEQVEGKINGDTIVILTKFLKKSN